MKNEFVHSFCLSNYKASKGVASLASLALWPFCLWQLRYNNNVLILIYLTFLVKTAGSGFLIYFLYELNKTMDLPILSVKPCTVDIG